MVQGAKVLLVRRELASIIVDRRVVYNGKIGATGLPTPSFDSQSSSSLLYDELAESHVLLLEATEELHALILGYIGLLTSHSAPVRLWVSGSHDLGDVSLDAISTYATGEHVCLGSHI